MQTSYLAMDNRSLLVVVLVCRVALGCQCRGGLAGGFFVVVVVWSLGRVGQWFGCSYLL